MRTPDPTKDKASGAAGFVGEAAEMGNLSGNDTRHCPTIAQRRADSIRKQALGQIGGA